MGTAFRYSVELDTLHYEQNYKSNWYSVYTFYDFPSTAASSILNGQLADMWQNSVTLELCIYSVQYLPLATHE